MKRAISFYLNIFLSTSLFAANDPSPSNQIDPYFEHLNHYPKTLGPMGNAQEGEIEIVLDRKKIAEIEQETGRTIGIVAKDRYWLWINDPVKFPNGKYGVYGRLLWNQSLTGGAGVAVMAMLPNGKIVLNLNYRHATRSWEYELPRGAVNSNEKVQDAAIREVREETGMVINELYQLGEIATDTGITNTVAQVFFAKVIGKEEATPEDSEAIAAIVAFSVVELRQGFIDGYLPAEVNGTVQQIPLRDPFLAFALFQGEIRHLF